MLTKTVSTIILASTTALSLGTVAIAQDKTAVTVALPVNLCLANWPFYVAAAEGHFATEGLEVTMQGLDGSSAAIQAMLADQAQIAASAPADILAATGAGADLTGFYSYYQYLPFRVVAPADSAVASLADLKGTTIGITSVSGGEATYLRSVMSFAGIADTEYQTLAVGEGNMAATALTDGTIGAFSASFVDEIIFGGMGLAYKPLTAEGYPGTAGLLLAANTSYVTENPAIIEGLGRALVRATAAGLANRELVVATCGAVAPQETEDAGFTSAVLDGVDPLFTLADPAQGPYGRIDEATWAAYRDLIISIGAAGAGAAKTEVSNAFVEGWNK
jgi:NitT/TauT family transport system substrate-binding protein